MYKHSCNNQKIVPVRPYLEHYEEKELSLHFYGLGPKGMLAFKPSLTVNNHNY
jgi:hypothetical protein